MYFCRSPVAIADAIAYPHTDTRADGIGADGFWPDPNCNSHAFCFGADSYADSDRERAYTNSNPDSQRAYSHAHSHSDGIRPYAYTDSHGFGADAYTHPDSHAHGIRAYSHSNAHACGESMLL